MPKNIGGYRYIHRTAADDLPVESRAALKMALKALDASERRSYDVAKVSNREEVVFFIWVDDFRGIAHPAPVTQYKVVKGKLVDVKEFSQDNPRIYHRLDEFVLGSDKDYAKFEKLTMAEEAAGLLGRSDIGYRKKWEEILRQKGYKIVGHKLKRR